MARFSLSRAAMLFGAPVALALTLAACGEDGAGSVVVVPAPQPSTTGTPTPTPTPSEIAYDVTPCFSQQIQGQTGATSTLKGIIIPDTLKLDLTRPTRWPNGRHPSDPVVDLLLATLFLDMSASGQGPNTLANIPLDPPSNDKPFSLNFPFLAAPNGSPTVASGTGSGFDFRTDADAGYVNVDRMGNPAVATALIRGPKKVEYNDDNPGVDASDKYLEEEKADLGELFHLIGDDLVGLGLKLCAKTS
ncbi:DUF4331 domain-containing protein [Novosphingobium sp. KCTC 2891]|uniref:DUF4331 domain-containing protein n=1 Tax=Novosphingobium sp. KCTC 2891 TaxID=2989730 RepID=UPI0022236CDD|nr:DUF4331 domain-containing protein [Novosphingobium sp. KCTC 2891]MCW1381479.1 DUF4331 domain-containing protein [Novosphingobium sp. KCTC 2891]